MRKTMLAVMFASMAAAVPVAFAGPIDLSNTRPVSVNDGDGPGMQSILDTVFGCSGCVNADTGQSTAAEWQMSGSNPHILPVLQFEYAGYASSNTVGLWSGTDSNALSFAQLFSGTDGAGSSATVQWTSTDSGNIVHFDGTNTTISAFSGITQSGFGFYLDGPGGKFYSADSLNGDGGAAQMVAYNYATPNRWVMGFEDVALNAGADRDYNDFVFSVESVTAVPEPEIYAMLAAGLGFMGFVARRRKSQSIAG